MAAGRAPGDARAVTAPTDPTSRVLAYHERTKHHLHRYAASLGYLDWDTQPSPFRVYEGAPRVELPLVAEALTARYDDLYCAEAIAPRAPGIEAIAALLELSLGLTAWKEIKTARWALRANPSSGNLHPTEGYVVAVGAGELAPGVYHYASREHALERRGALDADAARELAAMLPEGALLVGLSSVHWREAWKYGERAFRYCQHDAGHAIATIRFAAAALGWSALLLDGLADADVAALLGLDRDEDFAAIDPRDREHPDALLLVTPSPADARAAAAFCAEAPRATHLLAGARWAGAPNRLSPSHVDWEVIDDAARATTKPPTALAPPARAPLPPLAARGDLAASHVILTRRSAVDLDGRTSIPEGKLYEVLDRLLPRAGVAPWDALPWAPRVHPILFVHRVRGLAPGLYAFERDPRVHERLRAAMHPELDWERPAGCPEHLCFYRLVAGDLVQTSQIVSCHQAIAARGAFSLGMVADFGGPIREHGAWLWRRLFWEAGVLGQVLYLEAEAASTTHARVRGTGIGCYFDDAFHDVCGLADDAFQSLYHFTIGGPVEDTRLATLPRYAHLEARGDARP
jgi:SagB-type dehydrogenase family enzyme